MADETQNNQAAARALLDEKLAAIDEQLTAMSAPPTELSNISFGKRVGDGTQMAVDRRDQVAAYDKILIVRTDVVRALAKLDEGSYGTCDVCREPIGADRLLALPWAVLCVKDAARR